MKHGSLLSFTLYTHYCNVAVCFTTEIIQQVATKTNLVFKMAAGVVKTITTYLTYASFVIGDTSARPRAFTNREPLLSGFPQGQPIRIRGLFNVSFRLVV
jgi:hypothetical protein